MHALHIDAIVHGLGAACGAMHQITAARQAITAGNG